MDRGGRLGSRAAAAVAAAAAAALGVGFVLRAPAAPRQVRFEIAALGDLAYVDSPRISPDGGWLAYQSDESGRSEIYVRQFPGPGGRWQVSTAGGSEPWWSADGRSIFYLDGDENMVSVAVRAADVFTAGLPQVLFEARLYQLICATATWWRATVNVSSRCRRWKVRQSHR